MPGHEPRSLRHGRPTIAEPCALAPRPPHPHPAALHDDGGTLATPARTDMMKDVNTVQIDMLSASQIEAARARRSKERWVCHL